MNSNETSPSEELGDTSGSRSGLGYSYQAACIAAISLDLTDSPTPYSKIYCEHQDDILIEKVDGEFIGIQVKTQGNTRNKLKSTDKDVIQSFQNFIALDNKYPSYFSEFQLIVNTGFWHRPGSGDDLSYALNHYVKSPTPQVPSRGKFKQLIDSLTSETIDVNSVYSTLKKVKLRPFFDFKALEFAIALKLSKKFRLGTKSFDGVRRVARHLIMEMDARCSIHEDYLRRYHEIFWESSRMPLDEAVIDAKTVSLETVNQIVKDNLDPSITLRYRDPAKSVHLPPGLDSMERKLLKGEVDLENVNHLLDCKYNAWEFFYNFILEDNAEMIDSYQTAKVVIRECCLAAQGEAQTEEGAYGMEMLKELRRRLLDLHIIGVGDSARENILHMGIVGILTEECEVWWSETFDIEGCI
ncbi:MAG: dsDNA nuclease domain-containing protein [Candidatus Thorarchaeota archaeon]